MSLNEKSMVVLKGIIAARLAVLREEIGAGTARARDESYGALTGGVVDRGDEASADLIADIGNAEVTRDARELRALEAALERIAKGEYGECADCEQHDADQLRLLVLGFRTGVFGFGHIELNFDQL